MTTETVAAPRVVTTDRSRTEERLGWKLVAPAVIVMLAVTAYPMFQALYLSLYQYRATAPDDQRASSGSTTTSRSSPTSCGGRTSGTPW